MLYVTNMKIPLWYFSIMSNDSHICKYTCLNLFFFHIAKVIIILRQFNIISINFFLLQKRYSFTWIRNIILMLFYTLCRIISYRFVKCQVRFACKHAEYCKHQITRVINIKLHHQMFIWFLLVCNFSKYMCIAQLIQIYIKQIRFY